MADFSALKTSIQNYIKQNGNEEITGNLLQQILLSVVTTLGDSAINDLVTALNNEVTVRQNAVGTLQGTVNGIVANIQNGYVYAGIATPSSTPASGKVFYLALTAGTYTNFGAIVVPQGINILKYNGSAWSLDTFIGLDDEPTAGSGNLVKSGGVMDDISKFDIQIGNIVDGNYANKGSFISNQGVPTTNSDYCRTNNVSVKFGQILKINAAASGGCAVVAFFDSDDTFISAIAGTTNINTLAEYIVPVPENTSYAVLSTSIAKSEESSYQVIINSMQEQLSRLLNKPIPNLITGFARGYLTKTTGTIVSDNGLYFYYKLHLDKGYYLIDLQYNGTQAVLVKYTDNTYTIKDTIIIQNTRGRISRVIRLDEGYYAIGWNNSTSYNCNDASLSFLGETLEKAIYTNLVNSYMTSSYIADNGSIGTGASNNYILTQRYLERGLYFIQSVNIHHPIAAKYTDNSYTTLQEIMMQKNQQVNGIFYLESGYYAFCNDNSVPAIIIPYDVIVSESYSLNGSLLRNKFINDSTGNIETATNYDLIKIYLKGIYRLKLPFNGNHAKMWLYTNNTFATPSKCIVEGSMKEVETIMALDGYYAICYRNDKGVVPKIVKLPDTTNIEDGNKKIHRDTDKSLISLGLNDLSLQNNSGSATLNNGVLQLTSNASAILTSFQCWYWKMSAKVLLTENGSVILGKNDQDYGFLFTLNIDGTYTLLLNGESISGNTGLSLVVGQYVGIVLEGKTQAQKTAKVSVIANNGSKYVIENAGSYAMYGTPYISTNTNCTIVDFSLSIQNYYDIKNIKTAVWGHSFVEGNSLGENRLQCFTSLLSAAIGKNRVVNFGAGGDAMYQTIQKMETAEKMVIYADYYMFCIGANDSQQTASYMINKLENMINRTLRLGITPILFTISPFKTGFTDSFTEVNTWIRNSGYCYVDMEKVFLNSDGTINNSMYLDNIHPTVAGHEAIFNRIMMDCPYLF